MKILLISALLLAQALADMTRSDVEAGQCSGNLRSRTCFGVLYNQSTTECHKGYDQLYCTRVALKNRTTGEWKIHNAMFATDRVLDQTQCVKNTADVMEVVCADKNCKDFDKMPLDRMDKLCSEFEWKAELEKKMRIANKRNLTPPDENDGDNDDDDDDDVMEPSSNDAKTNDAAAIEILNEKLQSFEKDLSDIPSKNEIRLIWAGFLVVVAVLIFMNYRDQRQYERAACNFCRSDELRLVDNENYDDPVYKPCKIVP